jgi:hypothetical protein
MKPGCIPKSITNETDTRDPLSTQPHLSFKKREGVVLLLLSPVKAERRVTVVVVSPAGCR